MCFEASDKFYKIFLYCVEEAKITFFPVFLALSLDKKL